MTGAGRFATQAAVVAVVVAAAVIVMLSEAVWAADVFTDVAEGNVHQLRSNHPSRGASSAAQAGLA